MGGGIRSSWATRVAHRGAFATSAAAIVVLGAGMVGTAPALQAATTALHLAPMQLSSPVSGSAVPDGQRGQSMASNSSSVCWESSNWSGYAVAASAPSGTSCSFPSASSDPSYSGKYTSVSATWTVPTVTSSSSSTTGGPVGFGGRDAITGRGSGGSGGGGFGGLLSSAAYSAVWTGVDGFNNDDLIQAGTEQDYTGGKASYSAWWEILPAAETTISSIAVDPGDSITVTITKEATAITSPVSCSAGKWLITLTDTGSSSHTAQPGFATCQSYSGPGASAEYIVEAPEVNGRIATLADYGSEAFGVPSMLKVNGTAVDLASGTGGEMVQGNNPFSNSVVSVASNPGPNQDDFNMAYGSAAPSPPSS